MNPSPQNTIVDPLLNQSIADSFISYNQYSSSACEVLLKTLDFSEHQLEQRRMDVTYAPDENFTCPLESQFQTEVDGRPNEWDPQRNHNEFYDIQLTKPSEIPIQDNTSTHFYDSPYYPDQNKTHSENQGLPNVDGNFHTPALSNLFNCLPHESNGAPQQSFDSDPGVQIIDDRTLGGSDCFQNVALQGILSNEAQTQQEYVQPRQTRQNVPPRREERTDSVEGDESLSEAAPSKKLKVESPETHSTACSTIGIPSSADSLEGTPQAENYNNAMDSVGTSSHIHSEEEHKQGVNEAALKKKKTTKIGFSPHRSAIKTLANRILRYLRNIAVFRRVIRQKVCSKYRIPMENIETYIECHVKGSVKNETELFNAIGNAGPKGSNSHLLRKEEAKRATWLVFQIFLGNDGHFERWVDDPVNGYQPHSRLKKGEKIDKESLEYLEKQEEKRKIYKKEGEREKLRKIFENSELSANPSKGRKKDSSAKKTKPEKEEEYISYEESLIKEILEDNEN